MPSGMTETQRTVFALVLLTYLCVVVKELPDASTPKVFSPDKAFASEKLVFNVVRDLGLVNISSSKIWWA